MGEGSAWTAVNDWCNFFCYFEKEGNTSKYYLDIESGGDGNVTVSFKFDDKNATIYGEEYMKQYSVGNFTWKIYVTTSCTFRWIFHICSKPSANVTLKIIKDLEPFPLCLDCNFQSIIKELKLL